MAKLTESVVETAKAVETTLRAAGVQQCSAAVAAAGSGGVSPREGTPGGDACATRGNGDRRAGVI